MENHNYIEETDKILVKTYNRYQIVIEKGEDVYLYDINGKKYLDFAAGIAVNGLGYSNEKYKNALKEQIDKVTHVSNLYYNVPAYEAALKFKKASGMDRVFFTNSGAEAIEGALKIARRYVYKENITTIHEIITMRRSFHGRTLGALSVTHSPKYRYPFKPLIPGVKFADYNDILSVKEQVTEQTCAIIVEPVQGEGGIHPASQYFLKELRKLCDQRKILLIFDEVQCGMGRTGDMFAWQGYGVKPDILVSAKGLGCGIPVGAFAMTEEVAQRSLKPGDHGTTYGGNPFACKAVSTIFDIFEEENILKNVKEVSSYLEEKLDMLVEKYPEIVERRGKGLLQGLEFNKPVAPIIEKIMQEGAFVIPAGEKVLRFVPPLVIKKEHVEELIVILEKSLS
ncbi:aspartate aminotransferase family protein [Anaerosacchariphilus polymeriproducens]|uniref:Acetylornithine aminotransferase n=1 Tax=Anaerosacchariphilus polymeriproducens TaxID=1812858 RepID=A0A371AWN8_9FIRM|nr:aspartate aminotransferase family protein [Anaerosacchariphilus polymeriproducens]RDU23988.1 aspartate aminotransferase family protein [Anaerosacchariphilus polymeriproducens]